MSIYDRLFDAVYLLSNIWDQIVMVDAYRSLTFGLIGALAGSFMSVIIYRLPAIIKQDALLDCLEYHPEITTQNSGVTLESDNLYRASRAPCCGSSIKWYQNLPLVSWLILRGKCSHCGTAIKHSYLGYELGGFVALASISYFVPNILELWVTAIFFAALLGIAAVDFKHQIIPDQLNVIVLITMVLALDVSAVSEVNLFVALGRGLLLLLLLDAFNLYSLKKNNCYAIGGGDIKLLAALAVGFGVIGSLLVLIASTITLFVYSKYAAVRGEHCLGHLLSVFAAAYWCLIIFP